MGGNRENISQAKYQAYGLAVILLSAIAGGLVTGEKGPKRDKDWAWMHRSLKA